MFEDLKGKVAVVTGAARGIGRGVASRLAAEGCSVVLNDVDDGPLPALAQALRDRGARVMTVQADVGLREPVDRLLDAAVAEFGSIDILVNNAGWSVPVAHLLEMPDEHWDTVMRSNLRSMFLCTRGAARHMAASGRGGAVVCISSFGASRAHRSMAAYDASKGGVESFTRAAALDLAPFGVRVNAVGPGAIHTEHFDDRGEAGRRERARPVPLRRVGTPSDIASAVAYLASAEASYVTGQVLYVDGGMQAQLRPPELDIGLPPAWRDLAIPALSSSGDP